MELVGLTEIAEMLDVSRQLAHVWAVGEDFPEPVAVLAQGRVWKRAQVLKWAERAGAA